LMGCANAVLHPFRKDMQFMQASIDNVVLCIHLSIQFAI
jgi:hypothetical protein